MNQFDEYPGRICSSTSLRPKLQVGPAVTRRHHWNTTTDQLPLTGVTSAPQQNFPYPPYCSLVVNNIEARLSVRLAYVCGSDLKCSLTAATASSRASSHLQTPLEHHDASPEPFTTDKREVSSPCR